MLVQDISYKQIRLWYIDKLVMHKYVLSKYSKTIIKILEHF